MTKEEYAKTFNRICENYDYCDECPIRELYSVCNEGSDLVGEELLKLLEIIEQWDDEHPVKTNRDKFEEVFGYRIASESPDLHCGDANWRECVSRGASLCPDCPYWEEEYKEAEDVGEA